MLNQMSEKEGIKRFRESAVVEMIKMYDILTKLA